MKKAIIVIGVLLTVVSQQLLAQAYHELSAQLGGGFSPLSYKLEHDAARSGGLGGSLGGGYTYFFDVIERVTQSGTVQRMQIGIHTGLGVGYYGAKAKIAHAETRSEVQKDSELDNFRLITMISGYDENQNVLLLTVPLMAHVQLGDQFYAKTGFKAGIPVSSRYSAKNVRVTNHGDYFEIENVLRNARFAGFGDFDYNNVSGDLDIAPTVMLALEGGMRFRLTTALTVYAGLYFDFGLNNSLRNSSETFITYNSDNPADYKPNSVLTEFADKARLMSFGVKINVGIAR